MMGERLVMQVSLFYEFRLKDHVPCPLGSKPRIRALGIQAPKPTRELS
jgi:hypothetical protein